MLAPETVRDDAIKELPIFRSLSAAKRNHLLRSATQHTVAPGTILFEQGETPNFQHVVVCGSARLFGRSADGREVLIDAVRAPNLIIPAAVVIGAPYLVQARASEPSRLLLIHASKFREAIASDPVLAQTVIADLARQFQRMIRQIKNLKLRPAIQRVGSYILALSARQGATDRVQLLYEKNLIASELGITPESFSRALSSLERSSIRVEGKAIVICNRANLIAQSEPDPLIDGLD